MLPLFTISVQPEQINPLSQVECRKTTLPLQCFIRDDRSDEDFRTGDIPRICCSSEVVWRELVRSRLRGVCGLTVRSNVRRLSRYPTCF